jgi:hypothetical protein
MTNETQTEKTTQDNLIQKTNKSYIRHFGLKLDGDFLFKKKICILDLDGDNKEIQLFSFLKGLSCVLDSKEFWNLELKQRGKD